MSPVKQHKNRWTFHHFEWFEPPKKGQMNLIKHVKLLGHGKGISKELGIFCQWNDRVAATPVISSSFKPLVDMMFLEKHVLPLSKICCHEYLPWCRFYMVLLFPKWPRLPTKGVKNCEKKLQWNVEFESRLWRWLVLFRHPTSCYHTLLKTDMETKKRALENIFLFHLGVDEFLAVGLRELVAQRIPKGTFLRNSCDKTQSISWGLV